MKFKATYLLRFCFLLLIAGISEKTVAQPSLGITWEVPDEPAEANWQLDLYSELGFTYIELTHPVDSQTLELLNAFEFTVLVRTQHSFLTLREISEQGDQLQQEYLSIVKQYRSNLNIAALGLLSNSQTDHPDFESAFLPVTDPLKIQSNKPFYFYENEKWYYFQSPEQPFGYHYKDEEFQSSDLALFHDSFQQQVSETKNFVFFISSTWLIEAVANYPPLSESFRIYQENQQWALPLPEIPDKSEEANWIVLLLIALWLALAVQLKYLPYARPMMLRYFLAHRFFVDDILHYRERAATAGVLLMTKHAIFGGIVFYISSHILMNETGIEAFFHHFPLLAITGSNYISFFFLGVIIILLTQLVAIFWLYLPAKSLEHISQSINLYAGMFYLDFLVVTVMVTLFAAGAGSMVSLGLAGVFLLIWYGAFNLAAFNASRNMGTDSLIYLLMTVGLHTVFSIAILALLLSYTELIQVIHLAVSL